MANEEAIKILKTLIPKTCKMVDGRLKGGFDDTDCIEYNAIQTAIDAIEKQIPKKYIFVNGRCVCPNCKENKQSLDIYCDNCGQAIDWSDEK